MKIHVWIAVGLILLVATRGEAQAKHALEGGWSGRDENGTTIAVVVEKVHDSGRVEGRWCYQYANKGIL